MPVKTPDISINPYTSTVPTVQMPPQEFGQPTPTQPLPGRFSGTGTGKLAIGDSILKGFLAGHEYKAQKKAAQAQATLAAADSATNAAYQKYQDSLAQASGNVKDPNAQAAYQAYTEIFAKSKEAKAKMVIPEEPKKTKGAKEKMQGAIHNIKDWMEANPHVVPQLALLSMQPQPQGLTPEGKKQQFETQREQQILASGQAEAADTARTQKAQKTYDQYSGLNEEQFAALPPSEQSAFHSAKNVLYPPRETGSTKLYTLPDGKQGWFIPGQEPQGAQPVAPASASGAGKLGSFADYASRWATENGLQANKLTTAQLDALKKRYAWDTQHESSTSTTVRPGIDSTTTTSTHTPGGPPPLPSVGGTAPITRPPSSSSRAARGGGSITAPPGSPTNPSPNRARMTMQATHEKETKIAQARQKLNDAMTRNLRIADPTLRKQAEDMAKKTFDEELRGAEHGYDQDTRAVGGTPGAANKKAAGPPAGATTAYRDKNGVIQGYAVNGQYVPVSQ